MEQSGGLHAILILDQDYSHDLLPVEFLKGLPLNVEVSSVALISQSHLVVGTKFLVQGVADLALHGVPSLARVIFASLHDVQVYS